MSDIAPGNGGTADDRISRAQELSEERIRNGQLQLQMVALQTRLSAAESRRERTNARRFIAMCAVVIAGLGVVLYLQIDSQGSGRLRGELFRQCEQRNINLTTWKSSLEEQAQLAEQSGNAEYANTLRSLSGSLLSGNCNELR